MNRFLGATILLGSLTGCQFSTDSIKLVDVGVAECYLKGHSEPHWKFDTGGSETEFMVGVGMATELCFRNHIDGKRTCLDTASLKSLIQCEPLFIELEGAKK